MDFKTKQKQLTSEELNSLIKDYRDTEEEKIVEKIYFSDIAFYISEASRRSDVDFDTGMSIIYQAVRHAVKKYDKDKGTFLSYCRLWIRKYYGEYINSLNIINIKIKQEEKVYYVEDHYITIEQEKGKLKEDEPVVIDYSILTKQEEKIVKLFYIEKIKAKKVCKMLNIKLDKFFAIKREAVNKIKRNLN